LHQKNEPITWQRLLKAMFGLELSLLGAARGQLVWVNLATALCGAAVEAQGDPLKGKGHTDVFGVF
jgi:hypothetical protein